MFKNIFLQFAESMKETYPELNVFIEESDNTGFLSFRRTQILIEKHEKEKSIYISFHKDSDPKLVAFSTIEISRFFKYIYIGHNFSFTQDGELFLHPVDPEDLPSGDDVLQ